MKKFAIIALIIILALSVCACGRNNRGETSTPTTSSTGMDIIPNMDPTIDTNIPDPNVNSTMPMYTEGTDPSNGTGSGGGTGSNGGTGSGTGSNGGGMN